MGVSYIEPLQRAWARAERMLFKPFRLEMWLVLGFAAFLSELFTGAKGTRGVFNLGERGGCVSNRVCGQLGDFLQHALHLLRLHQQPMLPTSSLRSYLWSVSCEISHIV